MGNEATLDGQEAVAAAPHEADIAVAAGAEAHVVAVVPRVLGRNGGAHGLRLEFADAPQLLLDHVLLQLELALVRDVLPVTATAYAEVGAGRFDAVG